MILSSRFGWELTVNLKDIDTAKFLAAVRERLKDTGATFAEQHAARAALQDIFLNLDGCVCTKTAADLADMQGIGSSEMAKTLALLEEIWAIRRVKSGRIKIIEVPVGERLEDFFNRLAAKMGYDRKSVSKGKKTVGEAFSDAVGSSSSQATLPSPKSAA